MDEWFDQAIRAHEAEHGPSGDAWNISAILDRLHRSAPSLPDNVGELVERMKVLESDCAFLLSVIESCDEAEAPSYEMDPEDTARIALIRSELKESAADT